MWISLLYFLLGAIVLTLGLYFLAAIRQGAPFVPSRRDVVQTMVTLAGIKPGQKAADLGAGDGRVVIAFAKAGAEAHGYEINPLLVWWARRNIKKAGLEGRAFIHRKSFWDDNFASFAIIIVFGVSKIMAELEQKLRSELRPGAKVVSNHFTFPTWQHSRQEGEIYLYQKQI